MDGDARKCILLLKLGAIKDLHRAIDFLDADNGGQAFRALNDAAYKAAGMAMISAEETAKKEEGCCCA